MSGDRKEEVDSMEAHPLVDAYLRRLDAASVGLPTDRRIELAAGIREHIGAALAASGTHDEAAVRNVLDRLGSPEEVAESAVDSSPVARGGGPPHDGRTHVPAPHVTGLEIAGLVILAIGGVILPVLGVVVGLVLVWSSSLWAKKDKLIATVLPVAMTVVPALVLTIVQPGPGATTTDPGLVLLLPDAAEVLWSGAFFLGPIAGGLLAAIYLGVRARQRASVS